MLNLARAHNPNAKFYQHDICEWLIPNTKYQIPINYDLITAWDSIGHVPIEQQQKVLTKLISSLNPNGVFIFSCGGTEQKENILIHLWGKRFITPP